jgi:hypothetical protein
MAGHGYPTRIRTISLIHHVRTVRHPRGADPPDILISDERRVVVQDRTPSEVEDRHSLPGHCVLAGWTGIVMHVNISGVWPFLCSPQVTSVEPVQIITVADTEDAMMVVFFSTILPVLQTITLSLVFTTIVITHIIASYVKIISGTYFSSFDVAACWVLL